MADHEEKTISPDISSTGIRSFEQLGDLITVCMKLTGLVMIDGNWTGVPVFHRVVFVPDVLSLVRLHLVFNLCFAVSFKSLKDASDARNNICLSLRTVKDSTRKALFRNGYGLEKEHFTRQLKVNKADLFASVFLLFGNCDTQSGFCGKPVW